MTKIKSLSAEIYSNASFARKYAQNIVDNAWNACYERPASLSLVPADLHNKSVLDAGCGPGITTAFFLKQGAQATGIDYSEEMIAIAHGNTEGKATLLYHDLNQELFMFEQSLFDIIYCSLVIHYIDDLTILFKEFSRILKPGGLFIFSTDHPASPVIKDSGIINSREVRSFFWDGYGLSMNVYLRPWQNITDSLEKNQFVIDKALEPVPTEECRVKYPREYEQLLSNPAFICVRAINKK